MPNDNSTYVAVREIKSNGVLAYAAGDQVGADAVRNLGLEVGADVARQGTKAAEKAEGA